MRRLIVASLAAVLVAIVAVPALAAEFHTGWGDAIIDDNAFTDPSGALLPDNQAWPRGQIRDAVKDGKDVRLRVIAFNSSGDNIDEYTVVEGDFVYKTIEHRFIVGQPIAYLGFDFCLIGGGCIARHRIGRPAPPGPTPTPTTQPGPTPTASPTPTPEDRDGDGIFTPDDCDDRNSTVWPGGREIAGNGVDDDCSGADQPGRITAGVPYKYDGTRSGARFTRLRVDDAPFGAALEVRCQGKRRGCPFARRTVALKPDGSASLTKLFRRTLRAGAVVEVWVTAPNSIGKVVRFEVKRKRIAQSRLCLQLGAAKPGKC